MIDKTEELIVAIFKELKAERDDAKAEIERLMEKAASAEPVAWMRARDLARLAEMSANGANNVPVAKSEFKGIGCVVPLYAALKSDTGE